MSASERYQRRIGRDDQDGTAGFPSYCSTCHFSFQVRYRVATDLETLLPFLPESAASTAFTKESFSRIPLWAMSPPIFSCALSCVFPARQTLITLSTDLSIYSLSSDSPTRPYGHDRATGVASNPIQSVPPNVLQAVVRQEQQILLWH